MTTRHTRITVPILIKDSASGELREHTRLVGVRVHGISWSESLEACLGFLLDEDVLDGHFASDDLEYLIAAAQSRKDH